MRNYPTGEYEQKEAVELGALPWMIEALKLNPNYNSWGPGEDYMPDTDKERGWSSSVEIESWEALDWGANDLNVFVNFHFEIERDKQECSACEGEAYNPATKRIADDWYDFAGTGRRWCDCLEQGEVDALWERDRLHFDFKEKPTAAEVNAWSRKGIGHDSINRWICVEARARRLGVWGRCQECGGRGFHWVEDGPRLTLVLWVLHPRKGCSRGIRVKRIGECDLPAVIAWLKGVKGQADKDVWANLLAH